MSTFRLLFLMLVMALATCPLRAQRFQEATHLLDSQPDGSLPVQSLSILDINRDGRLDLYHPGKLYLQQPDGRFVDVLPTTGIADRHGVPAGGIWGDYDRDGFPDLFVVSTEGASNLFRNRQNGFFEAVTAATGLSATNGTGSVWFDMNGDGWLDLFAGDADGRHRLFFNRDGQRFEPAASSAGTMTLIPTCGISAGDYDGDGDADLYLAGCSNDATRSFDTLLRNELGSRFSSVLRDVTIGTNPRPARAPLWLDYDNDGHLDLFVLNQIQDPPQEEVEGLDLLLRNNGDGTFFRIAGAAGAEGGPFEVGHSVVTADFDNDGYLDLFVTNRPARFFDNTPVRHHLYRNRGDGTFTDVFDQAFPGFPEVPDEIVAAAGDLNGDGWVDLVLASSTRNLVFLNEGDRAHWLQVALRGQTADLLGIGSRVEVYANGRRFTRTISGGEAFLSQSHGFTAHVGLGEATLVDSIVVRWPTGTVDRFGPFDADQTITLVEGTGRNEPPLTFPLLTPTAEEKIPFEAQTVTFTWAPSSDPEGAPVTYTFFLQGPGLDSVVTGLTMPRLDLDTRILLQGQRYFWTVTASDGVHVRASSQRSTFRYAGATIVSPFELPVPIPGVQHGSVDFGDYDADGDLDLLITGDTGSRAISRIYRADDSLAFKVYVPIDVDLLPVERSQGRWIDYDGDGDLDVLLTGMAPISSETVLVSQFFENRDGSFLFDPDPPFPGTHSGSLEIGDFDNDGDPDLLVTGATRLEPPYEPISRIYRNDGGRFTDHQAGLTPVLFGHASWADIDGDGDLDVALLGERGNGRLITRLYRNVDGAFVEEPTDLPGLAFGKTTWGDIDGDGDLDLLLTGGTFGPNLIEGRTRLFFNDGQGHFTPSSLDQDLAPAAFGSAFLLDYDGDGLTDVLLSGLRTTLAGRVGWLYRNLQGRLAQEFSFSGLRFSALAVGDYNGDGDLDFVLTGQGSDGAPIMGFFINQIFPEPIPSP
ncbi:MAG: hypothetical protein KatS3mg044_0143 [Rhodothermaceae bacterium]|nr:MAG: hypothetical protein KatS3mg044_0143 [Rhodothermaceae bacterium]